MPLPSLKDQFGALIAASSVSCTQPELDQTNRPVVDLLASWLGDLGFRCEIREVSPGKFNLLASYGSGPGGLVLAGHTDTVPYDEALWSSDPLRLDERDGRWYGLGSCDMKGFFPLAIEALLPLLDQPFRQPLQIATRGVYGAGQIGAGLGAELLFDVVMVRACCHVVLSLRFFLSNKRQHHACAGLPHGRPDIP